MKLGDVIILPIDHMFVFAAQLYDEQALEKIFKLTGKSVFDSLPLMISSVQQLKYIVECDSIIKELLFRVWPGPLMGVFKSTEIYKKLTGDSEVQVFMPQNSIAQNIVKKYGVLSVAGVLDGNQSPVLDQELMYQKFNHLLINIYSNAENSMTSEEPTVVDFRENKIEILRNGPITSIMLEEIMKSLSK